MLAILRQRNFALLWSASLISKIGDMVLLIALPFYVYDLTGSTLASGGMLIAETLPRVLIGSFAGVFVDRWDRRRTMVVADLARAAVLLPLLLVGSIETLWIVYAVGVAQAGRPEPRPSAVAREWRAGLAMVAGDPVLTATFVVVAAVALADGVANVLFVPYFRQVLGAGPTELGWMISATGLARVVGLWLM